MKLLIVSPDYLSHYLPLGAVADAWRVRGGSVVVASGPGMTALAREAGFETTDLVLGRGHNSGIADPAEQPGEEARRLARFLDVTREGPIPTLLFQAEQRRDDLLWQPSQVAARLERILKEVRPDAILVDHLAFAATLALRALAKRYAAFVTGHPTAVPAPGETYGVPPFFPSAMSVDADELAHLRAVAQGVSKGFTAAYTRALRTLDPAGTPPGDAFAATGTVTLFNYPESLQSASGRSLPPGATFLGAVARQEALPVDLEAALPVTRPRPRVYVSLGTFLSSRIDLLRVIADGLRGLPVDVVMAIGAADRTALGRIPAGWLVRPTLPQVAVLDRCDLVITHGGNNTVTEALRAGLPLIVVPLSTDQFAGAADIERASVGIALDARLVTEAAIGSAVQALLDGPERTVAAAIGTELRSNPGAHIAFDVLWSLASAGPAGQVTPPDRVPVMRS